MKKVIVHLMFVQYWLCLAQAQESASDRSHFLQKLVESYGGKG
jgi:hypothetical protein